MKKLLMILICLFVIFFEVKNIEVVMSESPFLDNRERIFEKTICGFCYF